MIKRFKEFIKEEYTCSRYYNVYLGDLVSDIVCCFLSLQYKNSPHLVKLTDTICKPFIDWYKKNIPKNQQIFDIEVDIECVPEYDDDGISNYYYDGGHLFYDPADLKIWHSQILSFFDTDPFYADMKEYLTLDELTDTFESTALDQISTDNRY